ncbi:carbohydrate ABC transporter permease [Paraburkholderia caballeronis]|uniref:Carbohydrate ABC transporter membrane protein 1, CUT1 family n=1 Tax=Paraburkholderia caballeronis TaxID=416943 RepID=A0A1H7S545_9BURK|nr:sugar ABC transporter permease [Paraburkholderia caballeronis]PXW22852.1 carbohydrate ABC transporter membrane protein 1 (CUT1 family) [Paraburkholderia caballeronis]PXW97237.1 carbohydrate ABC transporter membrane protein 1 (CUT1 family) [Paraburkholderia caballeronis]RAJ93757.1 carbohydrate ABC transporter membrane protein 1 (CUT1 family) [Paraburkholderia caballeronis]TDV13981.1 carbohydrate ABC transporter membrane protein 1 (CUT1 family) [Paraburkholderia caballeronis]TDV15494.1 carboh
MSSPAVRPLPPRRIPFVPRSPAFWFLAPAVLALAAIGVYPMLVALYNSFHHYNLTDLASGTPFVGLDNYIATLTDPSFWGALGRTLAFLLLTLPIELGLGLFAALLLHRQALPRVRAIARVSLVIPMATTYAVVGLIGRLVFNRQFGIANYLLGLFGVPPLDWLGDPTLAFVSVMIMDIWQWTPFCALILLAGLSMVPREVEEAARLETPRWSMIFWHQQRPYLLPGITAILILRSADMLKMFDAVFTMTRGGPGTATEFISIYIQRVGFRIFDQGMASAQAVLLLVLTIVLSRLYIRYVYREA